MLNVRFTAELFYDSRRRIVTLIVGFVSHNWTENIYY
jgi:hypothetical protein